MGLCDGFVACAPFPCRLPPPSCLQGALIRAEIAKEEKIILANKLFAVYEQVKAALE